MKRVIGKLKNQAGLTLVEIIISMFILSIIITSFSGVLVYATRVSKDNRVKTAAINLANEEIEKIRSMKFADIGNKYGDPPGDIPTEREETVDGIAYKVSTLINWEEQGEWTAAGNMEWDYKSVRVTVSPVGMNSNPNLAKMIETYVTRDSTQPAITGGNLRIGLVRGWNTDPANKVPVSGVKVNLYRGAALSRIVYTTSEGVARFTDLDDGNYKVTVDPSSKGMIINPAQVSGWDVIIAGTTTLTELFEVENPCYLNFILKDISGSPIDIDAGTVGKISLQAPYGDPVVKNFSGSNINSEGELPNAFISDLWPVGEGYSGQYKITEVTIPELIYLGSFEGNERNETEWEGKFDGPGTHKNITCYFYQFPETPGEADMEWVTTGSWGAANIETGTHVSSNGSGDIISTSVSTSNQSKTINMPASSTSDITASAIYFDNTGSNGNPGLLINTKSHLKLRTGLVVFRGEVKFAYDSNSNNIGDITLRAEYEEDSDSVINGSEIGGVPGESYGKLYLAEPVVLNNQVIIDKGVYYFRDGIELPGATVNNTDLIPVTKDNYVE